MSTQAVRVPDIGSDEADVIEILVKPGDAVAAEQSIVVLESAKASMEVPCPQAGRVAELAVTVGQSVKPGDVLLQLETEAETGTAAAEAAPEPGDAPAPSRRAAELPVEEIGEELHEVSEILTPPGQGGGVAPARNGKRPNQAAPASGEVATVKVPDIGSESAEVIEILVKPGETIAAEQSIVVLESAKASMEVPSTVAGTVQKVLVKAGDKVFEHTPLLEVAVSGAGPDAAAPPPAPPARAEAPAAPQSTEATESKETRSGTGLGSATLRALAGAVSQASSAGVHAGPAVRRLARELGVDLARVNGSGPRGRILKEDVHAFVKQTLQQPPVTAAGAASTALPVIDFAKWGEIERVPLGKIQKLSARNLHRAWSVIPHVTQFDEADISELEAFRQRQKEAFKADGLSLTLLSFLVKACAHLLQRFPRFNSSLENDGEHLVQKHYIHIGVAVDTPNGLVVPVIRDADRKSIRDIARALGELSAKARDKKLTPAEMQGACFSISSLGGIGGTAFTPIVNWPEVAILGVSRAATKPVWDGQAFQPRLMLPLSLSYDHRVIDGADAARFTTALAKALGDIRELLL